MAGTSPPAGCSCCPAASSGTGVPCGALPFLGIGVDRVFMRCRAHESKPARLSQRFALRSKPDLLSFDLTGRSAVRVVDRICQLAGDGALADQRVQGLFLIALPCSLDLPMRGR